MEFDELPEGFGEIITDRLLTTSPLQHRRPGLGYRRDRANELIPTVLVPEAPPEQEQDIAVSAFLKSLSLLDFLDFEKASSEDVLTAYPDLVEEAAGIRKLYFIARNLELNGMPVLKIPGMPENAWPVFDLTSIPALRSLQDPELDQALDNPDLFENFDTLVREAVMRSGRVQINEDGARTVSGAITSLGGSFRLRTLSARPATSTLFEVHTKKPGLVVNYFYQAKYTPTVFGKSSPAQRNLPAGQYCFEAIVNGSLVTDPGVHHLSAVNPRTDTTAF